MADRERDRCLDGFVGVGDAVMPGVMILQPLQDGHRFLLARFEHLDLLEAPR
jgi:hypothetical protein